MYHLWGIYHSRLSRHYWADHRQILGSWNFLLLSAFGCCYLLLFKSVLAGELDWRNRTSGSRLLCYIQVSIYLTVSQHSLGSTEQSGTALWFSARFVVMIDQWTLSQLRRSLNHFVWPPTRTQHQGRLLAGFLAFVSGPNLSWSMTMKKSDKSGHLRFHVASHRQQRASVYTNTEWHTWIWQWLASKLFVKTNYGMPIVCFSAFLINSEAANIFKCFQTVKVWEKPSSVGKLVLKLIIWRKRLNFLSRVKDIAFVFV